MKKALMIAFTLSAVLMLTGCAHNATTNSADIGTVNATHTAVVVEETEDKAEDTSVSVPLAATKTSSVKQVNKDTPVDSDESTAPPLPEVLVIQVYKENYEFSKGLSYDEQVSELENTLRTHSYYTDGVYSKPDNFEDKYIEWVKEQEAKLAREVMPSNIQKELFKRTYDISSSDSDVAQLGILHRMAEFSEYTQYSLPDDVDHKYLSWRSNYEYTGDTGISTSNTNTTKEKSTNTNNNNSSKSTPTTKASGNSTKQTTEAPVQKPVEAPVQQTVEAPAQKPVEDPAQKPVEASKPSGNYGYGTYIELEKDPETGNYKGDNNTQAYYDEYGAPVNVQVKTSQGKVIITPDGQQYLVPKDRPGYDPGEDPISGEVYYNRPKGDIDQGIQIDPITGSEVHVTSGDSRGYTTIGQIDAIPDAPH